MQPSHWQFHRTINCLSTWSSQSIDLSCGLSLVQVIPTEFNSGSCAWIMPIITKTSWHPEVLHSPCQCRDPYRPCHVLTLFRMFWLAGFRRTLKPATSRDLVFVLNFIDLVKPIYWLLCKSRIKLLFESVTGTRHSDSRCPALRGWFPLPLLEFQLWTSKDSRSKLRLTTSPQQSNSRLGLQARSAFIARHVTWPPSQLRLCLLWLSSSSSLSSATPRSVGCFDSKLQPVQAQYSR